MSAADRQHCFEELANLVPPGYGDPFFARFCTLQANAAQGSEDNRLSPSRFERGILRLLFPELSSPRHVRASIPATTATPRSKQKAQHNTPKSLGRPSLPRRAVNVYVYLRADEAPLTIVAEGLFDNGLIHFRLGQESVKAALAHHPDGGERVRLEMWSEDLKSFVKSSRNDTQHLLPGEGCIYSKYEVAARLDFDVYRTLALPAASRSLAWRDGPSVSPSPMPSRLDTGGSTRVSDQVLASKRPPSPSALRQAPPTKRHASRDQRMATAYSGKGKQRAAPMPSDDIIDLTLDE
ncbi:hypothetical protein FKP32DRAFT_1670543 [Trametes sanguinea]|nr:hypothetical protein FKP32DRAFT_1670543 [Trametes sanguinea]